MSTTASAPSDPTTDPDAATRPGLRPRPTRRELVDAARTPRMLGLLAILVVAAIVCVRLGAWQIDRAYATTQAAAQAQAEELAHTAARPLGEVVEPGAHLMGRDVGRPVTVTGVFVPELEVLVPGRSVDGVEGDLVVTPLRETGRDDRPWVVVVRGFVATDAAADADGRPVVPPAPAGEVTLLGSVAAGEAYVPAPPREGEVPSLSPAYFAGVWGLPIYNVYVVQAEADPGLVTLDRPTLETDDGGNLRNLAYAAEWFVFAGFALVVWYRMVRDEAIDRRPAPAAAPAPDPR